MPSSLSYILHKMSFCRKLVGNTAASHSINTHFLPSKQGMKAYFKNTAPREIVVLLGLECRSQVLTSSVEICLHIRSQGKHLTGRTLPWNILLAVFILLQ